MAEIGRGDLGEQRLQHRALGLHRCQQLPMAAKGEGGEQLSWFDWFYFFANNARLAAASSLRCSLPTCG